jgi:hypothetical protein
MNPWMVICQVLSLRTEATQLQRRQEEIEQKATSLFGGPKKAMEKGQKTYGNM